ncbi:Uncharacterised protein [Mycobacteroides abscessus subsp. abscessus]|nr:Uncharacterised protein [Mycobacteroides abscessus subsp. abscessus]
MVNFDGLPSIPTEPTDSTYGCHQDGTDTDSTPDQFRGSAPEPVNGFCWQLALPPLVLPAAATTTASFSATA